MLIIRACLSSFFMENIEPKNRLTMEMMFLGDGVGQRVHTVFRYRNHILIMQVFFSILSRLLILIHYDNKYGFLGDENYGLLNSFNREKLGHI